MTISTLTLEFPAVAERTVTAVYDGRDVPSDAGVTEANLQLTVRRSRTHESALSELTAHLAHRRVKASSSGCQYMDNL
ncbi:MAG: hypothetical protein ACYDBB_17355 [Armatimonadota bacterium]